MQDISGSPDLSERMSSFPAAPVDQASAPCDDCNRLWLENKSGRNLSVTVSVGGVASGPLPDTASEPTLLTNNLSRSSGPIDLSVNGTSARLLDGVSPDLVGKPEDIQVSLIAGAAGRGAGRIDDSRGIPLSATGNDVDISMFLPDGLTESNTDIDLVMVCMAAEGPGAISATGAYQVDNLTDTQLDWFLISLGQNFTSSTGNEAGSLALFAKSVADDGRRAVIAAVKELVLGGRFYVKSIAAWGGRHAIIFKGLTNRSFLTAATYSLGNSKMSYISSYAEVAAERMAGRSGFGIAARSARSGNLIGFLISAVFDCNDFIRSEDPEKNWGDLLGALGVTFVKVWAAGFAGLLFAGAVIAGAASTPVLVAVGIGVGVSIIVGIGLDKLDDWLGVKEAARKIGRFFYGATARALNAGRAFVERIVKSGQGLVDSWLDDFQNSLRESDPNGWCALFCSSQVDQVNAWHRAFGMPGGIRIPGR